MEECGQCVAYLHFALSARERKTAAEVRVLLLSDFLIGRLTQCAKFKSSANYSLNGKRNEEKHEIIEQWLHTLVDNSEITLLIDCSLLSTLLLNHLSLSLCFSSRL